MDGVGKVFVDIESRTDSHYRYNGQDAKDRGKYVKLTLSSDQIALLMLGRSLVVDFTDDNGCPAFFLDIQYANTNDAVGVEPSGNVEVEDYPLKHCWHQR